MIYAKKTITGYKEENSNGAEYVILSLSEYDSLQANLRKAELDAVSAKKQSENRIKEISRDYERKLSDLDNRNSDLRNKLNAAENLNSNLKRICRERANSERKITPKKLHDGYIILRSAQYKTKTRAHKKEEIIWKTVIQTPYSITVPLQDIQPEIEKHLSEVLCTELGCTPERWRYLANRYWEVEIETDNAIRITENRLQPIK